MSAKRRQEAIARFSVPIEEQAPEQSHGISVRRRRSIAPVVTEDNDDDKNDADFNMEDDTDDSDDDAEVYISQRAKNKGKGKENMSTSSLESEDNPRVMLLSLKAVCPHS